MATRLYLDATADSETPISPAPDAAWENVSILARVMTSIVKSGEAFSTVSFSDADVSDADVLFRQYVSPPLTPGQSVTSAGLLRAQCRVSETHVANNMKLSVGVRIIANDGLIVRKVLSPVSRDVLEAALTLVNRGWVDPADESYTTVRGDRVVVEIGMGGDPASGRGHNCSMRLGSASGTDLGVNDTDTDDFNPWVELNDNLTFDAEPAIVAGAAVQLEFVASIRRAAGAAIQTEWTLTRRWASGVALMVEYYPFYTTALWGGRFAFSSTCAADIDAAALGPTKMVTCWTEPNDPLESIRVRAGLYNTPFMDFLVPGRVAARPGYIPRIAAIGPSKFVVAYSTGTTISAVCGRVDLQSDIEIGIPEEFESTATGTLDVCGVSENKFAIAFSKQDDSDKGYVEIGTVTLAEGGAGLSITEGVAAAFTTRPVDKVRITAINTDYIAVMFRDSSDGKGYMMAGSVSGTTVSWGAEVEFDAAWDGTGDIASMSEVAW